MSTVEQYQSGQAAQAVKTAIATMAAIPGDLAGHELGQKIIARVHGLHPRQLRLDEAAQLIAGARAVAVGPRVCSSQFPEAPAGESVFLDELAEGMTEAGKARLVNREQAVQALAGQPGRPIVASLVEGRYQELCRTWHGSCCYWNLEKRGVRCIKRPGSRKEEKA